VKTILTVLLVVFYCGVVIFAGLLWGGPHLVRTRGGPNVGSVRDLGRERLGLTAGAVVGARFVWGLPCLENVAVRCAVLVAFPFAAGFAARRWLDRGGSES
jgi:hypothetical protein